SDGASWIIVGASSVAFTKNSYFYTGAPQSLLVPVNCTTLTMRAWGAGAGGGDFGNDGNGGGGGGFALASHVAVTPGSTLTITVGQGGDGYNAEGATFGG